jgi:hypothetical protein
MKKLALFLALPFLAYSCGEGEPKATETNEEVEETVEMVPSDLENEHMMGSVKSFEQMSYTPDAEGNIGEPDSCCKKVEEYNDLGFLVKVTDTKLSGEIDEEVMFEHYEDGYFKRVEVKQDGEEVFTRTVTIDGDNRTATDTDTTGQVSRVHKMTEQNDRHQPVSGTTYLADGTTYVGTWTYDYADGLTTGRTWTDSTGTVLIKETGEVNDKGWLSTKTVKRMDKDGQEVNYVETYTYDSLDEMGNWTQRTMYKDGEPAEVLKRSYAYYQE